MVQAHLEVYSPTPYGYRREGNRLVIEAREQQTVGLLRRLRAQGLSLRAIGKELARRDIVTRGGRPWHPDVIARILRNPLHARQAAS